jgi:hypothetical protein
LGCHRKLGDAMLNPNATLHEAVVIGEQQGLEPRLEQRQQSFHPTSGKEKKSSSFAVHFKGMFHTLYVWMD